MKGWIRVVEGPVSGDRFPLAGAITRIGSGPECEVNLSAPDLVGVVATVRVKGGEVTLYNRSESPMSIGDETIPPGGSSSWEEGEDLAMPGGNVCRLEFGEGLSPTATARQEASPGDPGDLDTTDGNSPYPQVRERGKPKNVMETAVTVIALVGLVAALVIDPDSFDKGVSRSSLDSSYQQLLAEWPSDQTDPEMARIREILQVAHINWSRGRPREARDDYLKLRNLMLKRMNETGEYESDLETRIDGFVLLNMRNLKAYYQF